MEIVAENITRKYRDKIALENFSWNLNIKKNLVHGLIGPNGAGKTTILKILAGIYTYESGKLFVKNIEEDYGTWARKNLSFLPAGERGLRFRNSVFDNALYYGVLKGIEPEKTKKLYNKYSKILRMDEFRDREVGSLSTGEKKKAMLLSALSTKSKLIILDEPSDGLDISGKVDFQNIIKYIGDESDTAFIISTHDLDFINEIGNYYTFISKGKNVYEHDGKMNIKNIKEKFLEINQTIPDYERIKG